MIRCSDRQACSDPKYRHWTHPGGAVSTRLLYTRKTVTRIIVMTGMNAALGFLRFSRILASHNPHLTYWYEWAPTEKFSVSPRKTKATRGMRKTLEEFLANSERNYACRFLALGEKSNHGPLHNRERRSTLRSVVPCFFKSNINGVWRACW